ncbi:hypothetical protein H5V45_03495 [Nocardioides sp. KIGAM211]|uniref:NAD glycohydrolase translocation F5/8 type C domain-containing protein n=1 Tax=Nocardioides luti TaxID=2761101 RepID=A0A7X0RDM8_9ACTN|nr:hypothetical protein [Nocardioides luti]MBB6626379.1 hypothetical protein [Nocardioides luti]
MDTCARCGHVLGVGRFCTNCGAPVAPPPGEDWRSGTAERPAVRPPAGPPTGRPSGPPVDVPTTSAPRVPVTPPPAAAVPPPGARYPLFADEVAEGGAYAAAPTPSHLAPHGGHPGGAPVPHSGTHQHRQPRRWVPWVAGFAAMALVAALGAWLLLSGNDDGGSVAQDRPTEPTRSRSASDTPSTSPTPSASDSPSASPKPGKPEDVARLATAQVPATAPPNEDTSGNLVRYEARNMLDGVATTCWRMPGDGTGDTLTFELDEPTTLREVGLINGYAKTATDAQGRPLDWYHGNRRILTVEWSFDDGTTVQQSLRDTRDLQTVRVDAGATRTVRLRLVSVSPQGTGRAARDYTAVSDVALVGTPG